MLTGCGRITCGATAFRRRFYPRDGLEMVNIIGCDEGPEADAAKQLRAAILKAWPWVETDFASKIFLIPNVQCHGETTRDIDLVVLASLPEQATFAPSCQLKLLNNNPVEADVVHVRSLCIVIEIKDHIPQDIRFAGTKVEVRYRSGSNRDQWHSASQQNERQKYSLRNYIGQASSRNAGSAHHKFDLAPQCSTGRLATRHSQYFTRHPYLDGTPSILRPRIHAFGSKRTPVTLAATPPESSFSFTAACDLLARHLTPTNLDRRRMDRIANAEIQDSWLDDVR